MTAVYPRLRELRMERGLKQRDLAQALGCSQQVYSNYELGQRDLPTQIIIRLAQYYQVSADYLLGLSNSPARL